MHFAQPERWWVLLCSSCGRTLEDGSRFCEFCGAAVAAPAPSLPASAPGAAQTSGKAIASLVVGFFFYILPAAIAGIILGHLSLSEIRKSAGRLKGEGLAIAGLVLGYLGIAGIPVILIVAAIAIPNLLRARIAANEASAVGQLRMLNAAEVAYLTAHPQAGFTCSLSDLRGSIDARLASGQRSGYFFELSNCSAGTPGGPNDKYQVVGYPVRYNQTGVRAFCSDESGVIKAEQSGSPRVCLESGSPLQ
ncbi:MAG TPA: DUF4190 domain-containing protein [Terriglobales bacterium]|nr:DUF4190 domain-containing protein [Terriglobales bacterium]